MINDFLEIHLGDFVFLFHKTDQRNVVACIHLLERERLGFDFLQIILFACVEVAILEIDLVLDPRQLVGTDHDPCRPEIHPDLRSFFISAIQSIFVLEHIIDISHQAPVGQCAGRILFRECDQDILRQIRIIHINQALRQQGPLSQTDLSASSCRIINNGRSAGFRIALFVKKPGDRNELLRTETKQRIERDHEEQQQEHEQDDVFDKQQHAEDRDNAKRINKRGGRHVFPALFCQPLVFRQQLMMDLIDADKLLVIADLAHFYLSGSIRAQRQPTVQIHDHHWNDQHRADHENIAWRYEQKHEDHDRDPLIERHEQLRNKHDIDDAGNTEPARNTRQHKIIFDKTEHFFRQYFQKQDGRRGRKHDDGQKDANDERPKQDKKLRFTLIFPHTVFLSSLFINISCRQSDGCGMSRYIFQNDGIGTYFAVSAERDVAQYFRARTDIDAIFQGRMTFDIGRSSSSQSDAVIELAVISDNGRFANDDTHAVVDHEPFADLRSRMNFDPRFMTGPVRDPSGQQMMAPRPEMMGNAVMIQCLDVRIYEQHFEFCFGSRIELHGTFDII